MEGFLLHASNRLENLAELLAEVLKTPLDPMKPETILVQSGGMQALYYLTIVVHAGLQVDTLVHLHKGTLLGSLEAYEDMRTT